MALNRRSDRGGLPWWYVAMGSHEQLGTMLAASYPEP